MMNNQGPWNDEKVIPIGQPQQPQQKIVVIQIKVFERSNYKDTDKYQDDINNFVYKMAKERRPHEITCTNGAAYVTYWSDLQCQ